MMTTPTLRALARDWSESFDTGAKHPTESQLLEFAKAAQALQREADAQIADAYAKEWLASPASMEGEGAAAETIAAAIREGASDPPRAATREGHRRTR